MDKNKFKSGFVSIIGMPNVGKSTLLNTIAGQKIAIISDKPQTTRNKILAIYTNKDEQIIFTDTPGIHKPHNKLGEVMVKSANDSMSDVDAILFCVDATKPICQTERDIAKSIEKTKAPCILVINKIDMIKKELGSDDVKVIATGGLATLIDSETDSIDYIDKYLTLDGLRLIYLKNK